MLDDYGVALRTDASREGRQRLVQTRMLFAGLQKRLLSSIEAFARTVKAHRATLMKPGKPRLLDLSEFLKPPGQDDEDPIEPDEDEAVALCNLCGATTLHGSVCLAPSGR